MRRPDNLLKASVSRKCCEIRARVPPDARAINSQPCGAERPPMMSMRLACGFWPFLRFTWYCVSMASAYP